MGLLRSLMAVSLALAAVTSALAGEVNREHKISIDFHINRWDIDPTLNDNAQSLSDLSTLLSDVKANPLMCLDSLSVSGYASPDGSLSRNKELSLRRAVSIHDYLVGCLAVPDSLMRFGANRVPWDVFRRIISESDYPWADEAIRIMAIGNDDNAADNTRRMNRLKLLAGGDAWRVLRSDILPRMRSAVVITTVVTIRQEPEPDADVPVIAESSDFTEVLEPADVPDNDTTGPIESKQRKPFYMAVYSNMLFDAAAVPNLGIELYLGKNWTIGANYMHAWWSNDSRHRYWRIYGGDLNVKYWLGKRAHEKPLTGHHIGAYVQAFTYDFEWGGKAYMAGEPGGNIFDRAHIGWGIEYGYSLPIAKRFNIDFSLGVGYVGGRVYEFEPDGDHYLWTATKNKHWFGPTKLEVSLVWLIGRGNVNHRKGGGQ